MGEYEVVRLDVDALGRKQGVEQKVARITQMFQSGLVHRDVAMAAIRALHGPSHGDDVTQIETTRLAVKPLDSVANSGQEFRDAIKHEQDKADLKKLKDQGVTPRRRPTL